MAKPGIDERLAAVFPKQTITRGLTASISASSQGLQAFMCDLAGETCRRRLPCDTKTEMLYRIRNIDITAINACLL